MTTKSSLADECSCSDTEDCERCKRLYAAGDRWLEDNGVKGLGMLLEENAALRAKADELHDQRHEEARKVDESRAEVLRLQKQRDDLQGAMTADAERLRDAERLVWGEEKTWGCDAPEAMADEIFELRDKVKGLNGDLKFYRDQQAKDIKRIEQVLAANRAEVERRRKAERDRTLLDNLVFAIATKLNQSEQAKLDAPLRDAQQSLGALRETTKPKMDFRSDATEDSVSDTVSWEKP